MTDKRLKKLSRAELLELLLIQTKEVERLRDRLKMAEAALKDRKLKTESTGNLAQAVIEVNGVMEATQAAAQQYLENIEMMYVETKAKCSRMLAEAEKRAEEIKKEAWIEAKLLENEESIKEELHVISEDSNK